MVEEKAMENCVAMQAPDDNPLVKTSFGFTLYDPRGTWAATAATHSSTPTATVTNIDWQLILYYGLCFFFFPF